MGGRDDSDTSGSLRRLCQVCAAGTGRGAAAERLSVGRGEGGELNRERREGVAPAI